MSHILPSVCGGKKPLLGTYRLKQFPVFGMRGVRPHLLLAHRIFLSTATGTS